MLPEMRLLNVFTGKLEEYFGYDIPEYAILSHTWGKDEVNFSDIQSIPDDEESTHMSPPPREPLPKPSIVARLFSRDREYRNTPIEVPYFEPSQSRHSQEDFPIIHDPLVQAKAGYQKVCFASRQSIADGYEYLWIDTCCIDKSSSAELSEAINSMYQWYQQAGVCYAYVEDVQIGLEGFGESRWFTRGWTLQELLAPSEVIFFGSGWTRLATRTELAPQIIEVTGIDRYTILKRDELRNQSIAQRMSWASRRETTRLEDEAYCLLGIFGVSMPLLYGEGRNAFIRLQEEILKISDDQSLFAWSLDPDVSGSLRQSGILAQSPYNFKSSLSVVSIQRTVDAAPYSMTNKGLQIEMPLIEVPSFFIGLIDCQYKDEFSTCLGILLKRTRTPDVFFRAQSTTVARDTGGAGGLLVVTHEQALKAETRRIFIPRDDYEETLERSTYQVKSASVSDGGFKIVATRPDGRLTTRVKTRWNMLMQSLHIEHHFGWQTIAFVFYNSRLRAAFAVCFDDIAEFSNAPTSIPMQISLSPLVNEPRDPGDFESWFHSLSYGLNYPDGIAYNRYPTIWFKDNSHNTDNGSIWTITAHLEAASHFGQKVRTLHVSLQPSSPPELHNQGKYVSLDRVDVWEPTSFPTNWGLEDTAMSNHQLPIAIEEHFSTLEVVSSSDLNR